MACISPSFNLEKRRNDVVAVIDNRNITEFLQKVPHALTPRYLVLRQDYCFIFKDVLGISLKDRVDIIETWPGIIGIDLQK